MNKYLLSIAAIALTAGSASAATIAETDTRNTGPLGVELSETLSFDGFQGTGTVVEVMLSFSGSIEESNIGLTNNSGASRQVSAATMVIFLFTSDDLSVSLTDPAQVSASTGLQELAANSTSTFQVSGSEQSMATFTGGDITQFLTPFDINVSTLTGFSLSGGGGFVSSNQSVFARGSVSIDYKVDPVSAVPLPASMPLLLAGLGGLWATSRRRRRS